MYLRIVSMSSLSFSSNNTPEKVSKASMSWIKIRPDWNAYSETKPRFKFQPTKCMSSTGSIVVRESSRKSLAVDHFLLPSTLSTFADFNHFYLILYPLNLFFNLFQVNINKLTLIKIGHFRRLILKTS